MTTFRYLTAGESHGRQLTAIVEGCPAGLALDAAAIDADLARRQLGYGRGARQQIEQDRVTILVRREVRAHDRRADRPGDREPRRRELARHDGRRTHVASRAEPVRVPRPGHADLTGRAALRADDLRDVIERASARETAARVACGAVARRLLERCSAASVRSHVVAVGDVTAAASRRRRPALDGVDADPLRCLDPGASAADARGDRRGRAGGRHAGRRVRGRGLRLSARRGQLRAGRPPARRPARGGAVRHPRHQGRRDRPGFRRGAACRARRCTTRSSGRPPKATAAPSNNAGGVEGGISTGLPIVVRAAMKPIATLMSPLRSVRLGSHEAVEAHVERSDVCAVPAAAVVGEAVVALCLAAAVARAVRRRDRRRARGRRRGVPRPPATAVSGSVGRLVGFMGAGKTQVGRLVAQRLDVPFVDTDKVIAERHGTIAALFARARRGGVSRDRARRRAERAGRGRARRARRGRSGRRCGHDRRRAGGAAAPPARRLARRAAAGAVRPRAQSGARPLARDEALFEALYARRRPLYDEVSTAGGAHGRSRAAGLGGRQGARGGRGVSAAAGARPVASDRGRGGRRRRPTR